MRSLLLWSALSGCDGRDACCPTAAEDGSEEAPCEGSEGRANRAVTILHTNDMHSHLSGWGPNLEYTPDSLGDDDTVGGFARLATYVAGVRAESDRPVLLVDGGDWMAGDVFELLYDTEAVELTMMGRVGYDAVTLGNHEYDWGPDALAHIIAASDAQGVQVPIVASNAFPAESDDGDDDFEAMVAQQRIQSTRATRASNGMCVGFLGLLGDSAQILSPAASPVTFTAAIDAGTEAAASLMAEGVDLLIALTHNGTSADADLAAAVPSIDVIVGGHTHTALETPDMVGDTPILQAGSMGKYVGRLDLTSDVLGFWSVESYELVPIDDTIAGDPEVTAMVDEYIDAINAGPLAEVGHTVSEPVLTVPGTVNAAGCSEAGLGDLVVDAYLQEANRLLPDDPVVFAFQNHGMIRDAILEGRSGVEAFSDLFRVLPLGTGTDGSAGYPLVHYWLTAADILEYCEMSAMVASAEGCNYFVEVAGMRCVLDSDQPDFEEAVGIDRLEDDGSWVALDPDADTLYHAVSDSRLVIVSEFVGDLTDGEISVTPKDANGVPIADMQDARIDANPTTAELDEYKPWAALLDYVGTLPDTDGDGLPELPTGYLSADGRFPEI